MPGVVLLDLAFKGRGEFSGLVLAHEFFGHLDFVQNVLSLGECRFETFELRLAEQEVEFETAPASP